MTVPPFKKYFATPADMTPEQSNFFVLWHEAWQSGEAMPVDGQISYLFCYAYGVLELDSTDRENELRKLVYEYSDTEQYFSDYCRHWIADCLVLRGDIQGALDIAPVPAPGSKAISAADERLSLRLLLGSNPVAAEIVALVGPSVTSWGRKNLYHIYAWIDAFIISNSQFITSLMKDWSRRAYQYQYTAFAGSKSRFECSVSLYSFSRLDDAVDYVLELLREAENTAREERGLPNVGEGWIAETALYHDLRRRLAPAEVIQHARPDWLGRQHLDIFIPSLSVAVEYQGRQHDEPVAFFGGEKAWRASRRRDAKKRRLCEQNGVRLIEVRPGYCLEGLIAAIQAK